MIEENLSHEEVFGHLSDDRPFSAVDCYMYLDDEELFRKFVSHLCEGKLLKMFPPTTLGEVRQWKKENK